MWPSPPLIRALLAGPAKEYELVETVRRVIALGDDEKGGEWEESWEFESLDADGWERLGELDEEAFKPTAVSYATAAQRIPG